MLVVVWAERISRPSSAASDRRLFQSTPRTDVSVQRRSQTHLMSTSLSTTVMRSTTMRTLAKADLLQEFLLMATSMAPYFTHFSKCTPPLTCSHHMEDNHQSSRRHRITTSTTAPNLLVAMTHRQSQNRRLQGTVLPMRSRIMSQSCRPSQSSLQRQPTLRQVSPPSRHRQLQLVPGTAQHQLGLSLSRSSIIVASSLVLSPAPHALIVNHHHHSQS